MNLTEPVNSDLSESALCSSELLRGKSMMMKNIFSQLVMFCVLSTSWLPWFIALFCSDRKEDGLEAKSPKLGSPKH